MTTLDAMAREKVSAEQPAAVELVRMAEEHVTADRNMSRRHARESTSSSPWANKGVGWNKGEPDQVEWV
ncbi:hypothetical protein [Nocardia grenadensis]|uniref:hypothetical protein n=1 Tax=Nocardia grenadensis TaxID=931537 RepID=UPI0007A50129|nr:hypothetical protein [Nocardia grenadensis]